jgi:hypothetical protein
MLGIKIELLLSFLYKTLNKISMNTESEFFKIMMEQNSYPSRYNKLVKETIEQYKNETNDVIPTKFISLDDIFKSNPKTKLIKEHLIECCEKDHPDMNSLFVDIFLAIYYETNEPIDLYMLNIIFIDKKPCLYNHEIESEDKKCIDMAEFLINNPYIMLNSLFGGGSCSDYYRFNTLGKLETYCCFADDNGWDFSDSLTHYSSPNLCGLFVDDSYIPYVVDPRIIKDILENLDLTIDKFISGNKPQVFSDDDIKSLGLKGVELIKKSNPPMLFEYYSKCCAIAKRYVVYYDFLKDCMASDKIKILNETITDPIEEDIIDPVEKVITYSDKWTMMDPVEVIMMDLVEEVATYSDKETMTDTVEETKNDSVEKLTEKMDMLITKMDKYIESNTITDARFKYLLSLINK